MIKDYSKNKIVDGITYGGKAGRKKAVIDDNSIWMIKFPQLTRDINSIYISYTTSPLSEYIGSKIYEALGFDVHETRLGIMEKKLVVACKDFVNKNRLFSAEQLFNDISEEDEILLEKLYHHVETGQSLHNTSINDWILILEKSNTVIKNPMLKMRFWDQFVVDAYIGNSDRHGGNWGYLYNDEDKLILAPVYDNGNSFFGKASEDKIRELLTNKDKYNSVLNVGNTPFMKNVTHKLDSISSIKKLSIGNRKNYQDLISAIIRIVPRINLEKIYSIIDNIPETSQDIDIISKDRKDLYKNILRDRYEYILKPAYDKAVISSSSHKT